MPQRSSRLLPALFAVPLFVACGYGDHTTYHDDSWDHHGGNPAPGTPGQGDIEEAIIDADELLDVDPGVGAGAFIEYESGGTYHVTTSCDVVDGIECYWDIVVTPLDAAAVLSLAPVDLESDDSVEVVSSNQLRLVANTGKDFDGFSFQTEPGAAIEVDALLDDLAGNRYLFWVGDGALHSGAPSNPIRLVPSAD